MSKFTEIPYIEVVLSELSAADKKVLLRHVNGKNAEGTAGIQYTVKTLTELNSISAGVTPVAFTVHSKFNWKGYAIKTTNHKCFLTFKTGIDLVNATLYQITSTGLVEKEYVSADYIRALLREDAYIDSTELNDTAVAYYEVEDIKAISEDILNALKPGDVVAKITGKQKHTYKVSYKGSGAGEGICLTYTDAGCIETQSYDYVDGHWVYNSQDTSTIE